MGHRGGQQPPRAGNACEMTAALTAANVAEQVTTFLAGTVINTAAVGVDLSNSPSSELLNRFRRTERSRLDESPQDLSLKKRPQKKKDKQALPKEYQPCPQSSATISRVHPPRQPEAQAETPERMDVNMPCSMPIPVQMLTQYQSALKEYIMANPNFQPFPFPIPSTSLAAAAEERQDNDENGITGLHKRKQSNPKQHSNLPAPDLLSPLSMDETNSAFTVPASSSSLRMVEAASLYSPRSSLGSSASSDMLRNRASSRNIIDIEGVRASTCSFPVSGVQSFPSQTSAITHTHGSGYAHDLSLKRRQEPAAAEVVQQLNQSVFMQTSSETPTSLSMSQAAIIKHVANEIQTSVFKAINEAADRICAAYRIPKMFPSVPGSSCSSSSSGPTFTLPTPGDDEERPFVPPPALVNTARTTSMGDHIQFPASQEMTDRLGRESPGSSRVMMLKSGVMRGSNVKMKKKGKVIDCPRIPSQGSSRGKNARRLLEPNHGARPYPPPSMVSTAQQRARRAERMFFSEGADEAEEGYEDQEIRSGPSAMISEIGPIVSIPSQIHLRKAKLMFFFIRYPSSGLLRSYFTDIRFSKGNTSQLVKWFSNFREFFYNHVEKQAKQNLADGVSEENVEVKTDSWLYKALNNHYNRNNQMEVPPAFKTVVEAALKEFMLAIMEGKDKEQSWKKPIYKIIARLDGQIPDFFRTNEWAAEGLSVE